MSENSILNEQFSVEGLSDDVVTYISNLKSFAENQKAELESVQGKNSRLEQKLKSLQAYNEELRQQIKILGEKVHSSKDHSEPSSSSSSSIQKQSEHLENSDPPPTTKPSTDPEKNTGWSPIRDADGDVDHGAIVQQICQAATEVARDQFLQSMVYEETSGLYYDYKSGYYFDAERSLYYDGNSGTYYNYNYETKTYEIHSQIPPPAPLKTNKSSKKESRKNVRKRRFKQNSEEIEEALSPISISSLKSNSSSSISSPGRSLVASNSDPEEGELSSSDSSEEDSESVNVAPTVQPFTIPCVRIIVTESSCMQIGKLFIVTSTGGFIGREGDHDVLLSEDAGCSKVHCKIFYNDNHYFITDLGSSNGTFVNGHRLSDSKLESEPKEIGHGSVLTIGETKLLCHVHPGRETCFECEPGIVQVKDVPKVPHHVPKEKTRKSEMKAIRKKYGLSGKAATQMNKNYSDRAGERRRQLGSDNPYEKTDAAHLNKSIDSSNKGFKMLAKMGWSEGKGLGKTSEGRLEPIPVQTKNNKLGLGDSQPQVEVTFKAKQKSNIWSKTQVRFNEIDKVKNPLESNTLEEEDVQ